MTEFLLWYGLSWLVGLVGLPFAFALFSRLPDRGYAFSRPLGLWLVSIVAWWIGNLKLLPFVGATCWLVLALLGAVGLGLLVVKRREFWAWLNWATLKIVVGGELLFLAAYAFMVNFRSFGPALNRSEKFFDYAFINAIALSPNLPPPDPWYGGAPMNYYYGGQLYMAVLSKLSSTEPSTGYNVGMGLVYAMAVLGCYGLGSNLIGLLGGKGKASLRGGLVGAGFIMVLGNIDALRQFALRGPAEIAAGKFPPYFDWPATARMVYDPMPDGRLLDILTEYPIYSFLNGDLHAHLLDIAYVTLALAFILNMYFAAGKWVLGRPTLQNIPLFLGAGLILGAPYIINAGDFATYLGLALVLLTLAELRTGQTWVGRLGRVAVQAGLILAGLGLVYLPYLVNFGGMLKGQPLKEVADTPVIGWVSRYLGWVSWRGTFLAEYSLMYGLFFFSIMLYFSLQIARFWRETAPPFVKPLPVPVRLITTLSGIVVLILAVLGLGRIYADTTQQNFSLSSSLLSLITLPIALLTLWPGVWEGVRASVQRQGLVIVSFGLLLLWEIGPTLKMELLGLVSTVLYFSLFLGWRAWQRSLDSSSQEDEEVTTKEPQAEVRLAQFDTLFFVLVALAAFITLFTENLYVRDIYTNRFNTMFKFWYQLWMLYGLAAVYATWRILSWRRSLKTASAQDLADLVVATSDHDTPRPVSALPLPAKAKWRWAWAVGLVFLAFVACACPVLGYWQATNQYRNRQGLDGEAWYAQEYPTEYPAMKWLRDLARDDPDKRGVVLEVNGMNYSWYDRISTYTGLPTIVGWPFHELQWRASLDDSIIWEAWLDMDRIYATTDSVKAIELLRRHNVRYVFVGQIENGTRTGRDNANKAKEYSAEALAKFGTFMKTIYADPPNNIYIYAFY